MRLWDFALDFYSGEGVAPLCLEWQDRAGVDVNVLIYAVWLTCRTGSDVTEQAVAEADAKASEWRDAIVRPLRAVRRHLKTNPGLAGKDEADGFRNRVKALELAAERIELEALEHATPKATPAFVMAPADRIRRAMQLVLLHYDPDAPQDLLMLATDLPALGPRFQG